MICVLDSGNNRIKLLNDQGQFLRHITHTGLNDTSCTALAAIREGPDLFSLVTVNWRSKLLCEYAIDFTKSSSGVDESNEAGGLKQQELMDPLLSEPVGLMETSNANLFIIQDKKRLHLCLKDGRIVKESLEVKKIFNNFRIFVSKVSFLFSKLVKNES